MMTTTYTYDYSYDASTSSLKPVDGLGALTNMTYDPGPHPVIKTIDPDVDEPTVVEPTDPKSA